MHSLRLAPRCFLLRADGGVEGRTWVEVKLLQLQKRSDAPPLTGRTGVETP